MVTLAETDAVDPSRHFGRLHSCTKEIPPSFERESLRSAVSHTYSQAVNDGGQSHKHLYQADSQDMIHALILKPSFEITDMTRQSLFVFELSSEPYSSCNTLLVSTAMDAALEI
jgi:hypothetical protein